MIEVFSRWFVGITGEGKVQPPAHTAVGKVRALLPPSIMLVGQGQLAAGGVDGTAVQPRGTGDRASPGHSQTALPPSPPGLRLWCTRSSSSTME